MSEKNGEKSTLIIGAGLVGGAVLREIVQGWAHRHRKQGDCDFGDQPSTAPCLDTDLIHITATREATLIRQLEKTRLFLSGEDGVSLEQEGELNLGVRCGDHLLRIEAATLDILPRGLGFSTANDDSFRRQSSLYVFLAEKRPKTLIIGAGLASIVAYVKALEQIQNLALSWILITLKRAVDEFGIETVAILGTTGLGGQGTNLVWTHQSSQEMDVNLTSKVVAAYGILGVLDRIRWDTDSVARWILLAPGSLLGYDGLDFGPVPYLRVPEGLPAKVAEIIGDSGRKIPLYQPAKIDLRALSDGLIPWSRQRLNETFLEGAKILCGETWVLSPLQFACLSHAFQMGFNSDVYIARILLDELVGKTTGYNQIPIGAGKVVEPSAQGQNERNLALARLFELERKNGRRSPAVYPALGSPRAQKEIAQIDLLYRYLTDTHGKATLQQIGICDPQVLAGELWAYLQKHPRLLAEITAVIPVISPEGHIYAGPHVMFLKKGVEKTSDLAELCDEDRFREFAALGAVDLRAARDLVGAPKVYETGVAAMVRRARFILEKYVDAIPADQLDSCGSAIDPRTRHWRLLTSGSETVLDPVCFIVQFLGGERPFS